MTKWRIFCASPACFGPFSSKLLEVNLYHVSNSQGFELLHISHRHHPAVELSLYIGDWAGQYNSVRLRSEVCRLLRAASMRVSASNVRYHRAVVRE